MSSVSAGVGRLFIRKRACHSVWETFRSFWWLDYVKKHCIEISERVQVIWKDIEGRQWDFAKYLSTDKFDFWRRS